MFVVLNLEPAAFRSLGEAELTKLALPEEDWKKILAKLTRMKESPEVNLEGTRLFADSAQSCSC